MISEGMKMLHSAKRIGDMAREDPFPTESRQFRSRMPLGLRDLLHELLSQANRTYSRTDVLRHICRSLLRFSGSDMLTIRLDDDGTTRCSAHLEENGSERIEIFLPQPQATDMDKAERDPIPEPILRVILAGDFAGPAQSYTRGKSFWTGDTARPILLRTDAGDSSSRTAVIGGEYPSLALVPIPVNEQVRGMLFLASRRRDFFSKDDIQVYEAIAETLGVAIANQGAQWALRERVKELTCLYGIERVASRPGIGLDEFLKEIVQLLPPGWQYPKITCARIQFDSHYFKTPDFKDSPDRQSAIIVVNDKPRGAVEVFYTEKMPSIGEGPFLREERNLLDTVAETIGRQVAHHEAQWALRERVKELTCLYGIARIASRPGTGVDQLLTEIVEVLPPGWQYPEITEARITLDGRTFTTARFVDSPYLQGADIVVNDAKRGMVEIVYTEKRPPIEEGPFLKEERSLINEIARQVGLIIEHREAELETGRLQEQLRHADRLATVGQLSAGVAHELNEPLAAILGFAQLAKESPGLTPQASRDVEKIMNAALHAREVIRKLMMFTRQMPTRKVKCDIGHLIKEGLYFLESRCAKEGIVLVRQLEEGLPEVMADPSQLHQVLVNLVVNAIQSMPNGGRLTISTRSDADNVWLAVEDTGVGMSPEVQKYLFMPFFTTKEVGQGTGLGLAVVHGIVTAHGGEIYVRSEVGKGSTFEVCLRAGSSSGTKERC